MNRMTGRMGALCLAAALGACAAAVPTAMLGDVVPVQEASRTVAIGPQTRYVNVAYGEVVRFVADGQAFAFRFNGVNRQPFDLQRVAPAGALDHSVMAYVASPPDGGREHNRHGRR